MRERKGGRGWEKGRGRGKREGESDLFRDYLGDGDVGQNKPYKNTKQKHRLQGQQQEKTEWGQTHPLGLSRIGLFPFPGPRSREIAATFLAPQAFMFSFSWWPDNHIDANSLSWQLLSENEFPGPVFMGIWEENHSGSLAFFFHRTGALPLLQTRQARPKYE